MQRRILIGAAIAVFLIAVAAIVYFAWRRPPQMGADAEVFRAVDALYTAVTARDERLLGQCEKRLNGLRHAGKLPSAAGDHLAGIIAMARQGSWQPAAEQLYRFMSAQRRE